MRINATHGLRGLALRGSPRSAPCPAPSQAVPFASGVAAALLMGALLVLATPARAETLYSISRDDGQLRIISPVDGTTIGVPLRITFPGSPGSVVFGGNGLASDPLTDDLYALVRISDGFPPNRWLVTIDPASGDSTFVGDTGEKFAGLAFDSGGTLYAVSGDNAPMPEELDTLSLSDGAVMREALYTLSLSDGTPTLVTSLGNGGQGEAIGFNFADGFLYHASGLLEPDEPDSRVFEKIDLDTLVVTHIPLSGDNYSEITALVFSGDRFLAADNQVSGAVFMSITDAGVVNVASSMDHVTKGIAFVPEPPKSLLLLAALGQLAVLHRLRRQRR